MGAKIAGAGLNPAPAFVSDSGLSQFPAVGDGGGERHFVGVFDVTAGGEAAGDTGYFHVFECLEFFLEIQGSEVTFGGGVGGKNNFFDRLVLDPSEEFGDMERFSLFSGCFHDTTQDMIAPLEASRALDGNDVERLLDHAQDAVVAPRIKTDAAPIILGDVEAAFADFELVDVFEALSEILKLFLILFEKIQNQPLRHFRTDGRKRSEMADQFFERFRVHVFLVLRHRDMVRVVDAFEGFECRGVVLEVELDLADGTVSVFGDDDVHDVFVRGVGLVAILAREEHHDVCVLLDGSRFAEIGEFRDLILTGFDTSRELREGDDRDIEFARELLEAAGNFGNFLYSVVSAAAASLHELQVVDDDDAEVVLGLEAARHGAHFHDVERTAVVDEDRRFANDADGLADLLEVVALEFAGAQAPQIHAGLCGDHAVDQLIGTHFQGEDADRHFAVDTDLSGDVEGEGRLTDGWSGAEDDEVGFLEAGKKVVEVGEVGRHAAEGMVALVKLVDALESVFEDRLDRHEILFDIFLRNPEESLLSFVEDFLDIFGFVVAHFEDVAGCADESAEHGFFLDDFGIVDDIGRRRDGVDERCQVAGAADPIESTLFFESVGDAQDVQRLAILIEFEHDLVDVVVGVFVEVSRLEEVGDLDDGVFVQHQRTEHRLLGLGIVGGYAEVFRVFSCHSYFSIPPNARVSNIDRKWFLKFTFAELSCRTRCLPV